jgi:transposase
MEALYLKSQGLPHRQIAHLVGISETTLRTYLHEYQAGGIERFKQLKFYHPQSALEKHTASLEEHSACGINSRSPPRAKLRQRLRS